MIEAWHWLILGVALGTLELLLPGFFLMWLGLAALPIAALVGLFPSLSPAWQLGLYAAMALAVIALVRRFELSRRGERVTSDTGSLNRRAETLIGQIHPLVTAIENGSGQIKIGDTVWRVHGPDLPAGHPVRITRYDSGKLTVDPA